MLFRPIDVSGDGNVIEGNRSAYGDVVVVGSGNLIVGNSIHGGFVGLAVIGDRNRRSQVRILSGALVNPPLW
jgi:hypothetical protein